VHFLAKSAICGEKVKNAGEKKMYHVHKPPPPSAPNLGADTPRCAKRSRACRGSSMGSFLRRPSAVAPPSALRLHPARLLPLCARGRRAAAAAVRAALCRAQALARR
jgi:hypothetical protein